MKSLIAALLIALSLPVAALAASMTNDDVIRMVRGGLSDATVLQAIDNAQPAFDPSPDGLIRLKQGGVSEAVIQRILAKGSGAAPATGTAPAQARSAQPACATCGTIASVREVDQPGKGGAGGAVAGGVVGGLLGNAIGGSKHRTAGTVLGATGGAVAGYQIQKHTSGTKHWEVSVRMDDGSTQAVNLDQQPAFRTGERVRIVNGTLSPL